MSEGQVSLLRQKRSALWLYFTPIDGFAAICNTCKCKIMYRSTSNNLRTHISRKHPFLLEGVKGNRSFPPNLKRPNKLSFKEERYLNYKNTSSLSGNCSGTLNETPTTFRVCNLPVDVSICSTQQPTSFSTPIHSATADVLSLKEVTENFNMKLINFFIKNFHSLTMVEEEEFKELISMLNPQIDLPTKSYFSNNTLPELYEKCLVASKELIKTGEVFCITSEMWTSIHSDIYLSVTAHFVDDAFKSKALLLDCLKLSDRSSNNLANGIRDVITDWGIEEKIQFATSKNDNQLRTAITDHLGFEHFNCFSDTLNTVVRESLENEKILEVIEKVNQSIRYIKMNSNLYEKLKTKQKELGEIKIGLKTLSDINSFRSIYSMLEKYVKLETVIKCELKDQNKAPMLTEHEWKIAEQIRQVIKPFEFVMHTILIDNYCPASFVIPVVNGLYNVCDNLLKKTFVTAVKNIVVNIKKLLHTNFGNIETSATLSVSTFLDPRFKNFAFSSKALEKQAKDLVLSALTVSFDEKSGDSNSEQNKKTMEEEVLVWQAFDQAVSENRSTKDRTSLKSDDDVTVWSSFDDTIALNKPRLDASSQALAEVQRYMDADMLPRNQDPLVWWKDNRQVFSQLPSLAKSQLCAVSTSVPKNRLSTKLGFILNERRNNLSAKITKMFVFLNANIHVL